MNTDELLGEIQDTNLAYLVLAQRLLKQDYAVAQFRLKLDDDMARLLMSLSSRQLSQLARTNQFVFSLRFADATQLTQVLREKREPTLLQTHASLLMAGAARAAQPGA